MGVTTRTALIAAVVVICIFIVASSAVVVTETERAVDGDRGSMTSAPPYAPLTPLRLGGPPIRLEGSEVAGASFSRLFA